MGLLHSLLGAIGLASAGQARVLTQRAETAHQRASELKQAVEDGRAEITRWKAKANALSARLAEAEHAAERLPKVERQLQQWKERDEMHVAKLAEIRERMRRAERAAALSQEHLTATETKLDVIEAALNVLDRRTRKPL
jgi:predicted  nucleic acid-binding Zn-ribbon protein